MSNIVYSETNFLLSYATGRDITTDRLVANPPTSIQIVMPSFCFMEALSVFEAERKRWKKFTRDLELEIDQSRRNLISPNVQNFIRHLQASLIEFRNLTSDFETRLFRAIETLSDTAIMIEPTAAVIRESITRRTIDEPTDNLILASILSHASAHGAETKAFLTENRKCFFENRFAKEALRSAGIKCFADASACLEWLDSLPAS